MHIRDEDRDQPSGAQGAVPFRRCEPRAEFSAKHLSPQLAEVLQFSNIWTGERVQRF